MAAHPSQQLEDSPQAQLLANLLEREWLETDQFSGYATSTPLCCPTRRYHGLLIARAGALSLRHLFLARFTERLVTPEDELTFSLARYRDTDPDPVHEAFEKFELRPWPRTTYRAGEVQVGREVLMQCGEGTVLCRYTNLSESEATLELGPQLACREADKLTFRNDVLREEAEELPNGIRCQPYDSLPAIHITCSRPVTFAAEPHWQEQLEYSADLRRGYEGHEDHFCPGILRVSLAQGESVVVAATTKPQAVADPAALWRQASSNRPSGSTPQQRVETAANDFLYLRGSSAESHLGVLAGFPWFGEWGRDTFIALPGLTLSRGRQEDCLSVLSGAQEFLRDGLLPNTFGPTAESSGYNSADAALWFARAVLLYERAGGQSDRFRPALEEIAEAYVAGTELGMKVDDNMLLRAGRPDLNPTWMDAQTSQGPVTPRHGYAVELCALWYSLLEHLEIIARRQNDRAAKKHWKKAAERCASSFQAKFWLPDGEYLADVCTEGELDESIRPNMVIAAALELSPLTKRQRAKVVARAERDLLTPKGLRTLSPEDPNYQPRYQGGPEERDNAYHQGTVWPWLLGFYTEAALRAGRPAKKLSGLWQDLVSELDRAGLNHISEVFDGDAPHNPGGTFAQAWNTAEFLRAQRMLEQG